MRAKRTVGSSGAEFVAGKRTVGSSEAEI